MSGSGTASAVLAGYASGLRFDAIPTGIIARARDCVVDSVAATVHGHRSDAGRIVVDLYSGATAGSDGRCAVLGAAPGAPLLGAEQAALVNGTLAHALELDSLRQPGAGVHPGAVLVPAALAIAQEENLSGRALLVALVAGCEVLFRIGRATRHSAEGRGFHAPGLTGPFGAAVACGHLLGLSAEQMRNAIGIAGSLGGGLLAFATADGGMVKRLHLGRAAAAGVLAARLAQRGFTGPSTVLEGTHGFLESYCAETDVAALTAELGGRFETERICFKAFACHITAHTAVQAVRLLRGRHGFAGADVAEVLVQGSPKMATLHANRQPADPVAAQYSIAFCVAAALLHDSADPRTFTDTLGDPQVGALSGRVQVTGDGGFRSAWATRTIIRLHDGRCLQAELDQAPGFADQPFSPAELGAKFAALTAPLGAEAAPLFERLQLLEHEASLRWLSAARTS